MRSRVYDAFFMYHFICCLALNPALQWCEHPFLMPFVGIGLYRENFHEAFLDATNILSQTTAVGFGLPVSFSVCCFAPKLPHVNGEQNLESLTKAADDSVDSGLHLSVLIIYISPIFVNLILGILYTRKCIFICTCLHVCVKIRV